MVVDGVISLLRKMSMIIAHFRNTECSFYTPPSPALTPPAFEPGVFPHESFSPINVPELLPDPVPLIGKPTVVTSKDSPPLALRRSARVCKPPGHLDL